MMFSFRVTDRAFDTFTKSFVSDRSIDLENTTSLLKQLLSSQPRTFRETSQNFLPYDPVYQQDSLSSY